MEWGLVGKEGAATVSCPPFSPHQHCCLHTTDRGFCPRQLVTPAGVGVRPHISNPMLRQAPRPSLSTPVHHFPALVGLARRKLPRQ